MRSNRHLDIGRTVRVIFGTATVVFALLGFIVGEGSGRLFAASAAFGAVWFGWDLLLDHLFRPLGGWASRLLTEGTTGGGGFSARPSLDDTVRLLERHLARPTSRQVDINAAIRLEEIYRVVKQDPARAREVIRVVRERYPDAPELQRFEERDAS